MLPPSCQLRPPPHRRVSKRLPPVSEPLPVSALLRDWTARLAAAGCDSARLDTEVLICDALGVGRAWLVAHSDETLDEAVLGAVDQRLRRRLDGEPVAYVVGHREFWSLSFEVSPATLVPRADTELLAEVALALLPVDEARRVADLGTGSGILAVVIARERALADVVASDTSAAALAVATRNVAAHAAGRVSLLHGDWWTPLAGRRFDLVISNPPYVAVADPHLQHGDLRHEPRSALVAGADGLADIDIIIAGAPAHLADGGRLLLEHGFEQAGAVCARLRDAGFVEVITHADLAGRARVSGGRLAA